VASDPIQLDTEVEQRATARRLWARLEAVHTPVYFTPEVASAQRGLGLRGRMMGYAASRTAPLGPIGAEVGAAVLHGFAPRAVARALPEAWSIASPAEVLAATQAGLGRVFGPLLEGLEDEVALAAELAREAALLHPTDGRALAAAWSAVPWPEDPPLVLWLAATRIREARGDGHVACLVAAGLDGIESHLTLAGDSTKLRERLGPLRGWSEPEWDAAARRLVARGLLTDDGALTPAGSTLRDDLEQRTDALAAGPWVALGSAATERLRQALSPIVRRVAEAGIVPPIVTRRVDT
jgi:hypothetical protein